MSAPAAEQRPNVSIVIPVYNEEGILHSSVVDLVTSLDELGWSYELLLAENGSSDRTVALGEELSKKYPRVSIHSLGEPNYGKALREGILRARGRFVICDEIDLCDTDFYQRALSILEHDAADMVVGSKVMEGAEDRRPFCVIRPRSSSTACCACSSASTAPTLTASRRFAASGSSPPSSVAT